MRLSKFILVINDYHAAFYCEWIDSLEDAYVAALRPSCYGDFVDVSSTIVMRGQASWPNLLESMRAKHGTGRILKLKFSKTMADEQKTFVAALTILHKMRVHAWADIETALEALHVAIACRNSGWE